MWVPWGPRAVGASQEVVHSAARQPCGRVELARVCRLTLASRNSPARVHVAQRSVERGFRAPAVGF